MKNIASWLGYFSALFLSLFVVLSLLGFVPFFDQRMVSSVFMVQFGILIIILLMPLFLRFIDIKNTIEKFMISIGDIDAFRKELFKFRNDFKVLTDKHSKNTEIFSEIASHNEKRLENIDRIIRELYFTERADREMILESAVSVWESLYSKKIKMNEMENNDDQSSEIQKLLRIFEKKMNDGGIQFIYPAQFDEKICDIDHEIEGNVEFDKVIRPAILYKGSLFKNHKALVSFKTLPSEPDNDNESSSTEKSKKETEN